MVAYLPGERSVVIGRSPILGEPIGMLLLARDATVTYCHSKTTNLPAVVGEADILIAAVGRPGLIKGDWIKPGAVVIDAGYNPGNIGDVEYEAAEARDSLITPVPGGVGPTTIAVLLAQPLTRHGQASPEANCGRDSPQTVETSVVVILASGVLACSCPRPAGVGWACPRGMGSARLPVFSAAGRLCSVRLARIEAFKCCPVGTGPGEYERQRWPGLAVDPAGDRAFVVGAGEPIAVVDLRTLAFRYRPWPTVTGAPPATRTFPRQVQPELISMWVRPAARGRGVGDRLVGAVEQWARQAPAGVLRLAVAQGNPAALALYQRNGFTVTGELGDLMPDGVRRELIMTKTISVTAGYE